MVFKWKYVQPREIHLVVLAVAGDTSLTGVGSGTTRVPCGTRESYKIMCLNMCIGGNIGYISLV